MGNKKQIDWGNVALMVFCGLLIILIFKTFLIPAALGMLKTLLRLVDLYKLLEMPYLFFGSALFLFISWYIFSALCNITYFLFKFVMTTSIYSSEKKDDSKEEIREGSYCTQCGKHIEEGQWQQRDGHLEKYFFGLLEKDAWDCYYCSDKCYRKFVRNSEKGNKKK